MGKLIKNFMLLYKLSHSLSHLHYFMQIIIFNYSNCAQQCYGMNKKNLDRISINVILYHFQFELMQLK